MNTHFGIIVFIQKFLRIILKIRIFKIENKKNKKKDF